MILSTSAMHWQDHLRRCSGDATLMFEDNGSLTLLAARHRIYFCIVGGGLTVSARICNWPGHQSPADQQAWLQRILTLTRSYAGQRQEIAGLIAGDTLQLSVWIPDFADYAAFCLAYDRYIDALAAWRHFLLPITSDAVAIMPQATDPRFACAPFNIQPSTL